jgi:ABC-type glycerol-3-phosphate transport system permease component
MAKVGDAKGNRGLTIGTYAILTVVGAVMVFPFILAVATSFKSAQDVYNYPPRLLPRTNKTVDLAAPVTTAPPAVEAPPTTAAQINSDLGIDLSDITAETVPAASTETVPASGGIGAELGAEFADPATVDAAAAEPLSKRPLFTVRDETGATRTWALVEDGISANTYVDPADPTVKAVRVAADVRDLGRTVEFKGEARPVFEVVFGGAKRELVQQAGFTLAGRFVDPADPNGQGKSVLLLKSDAAPLEKISFRGKNYSDLTEQVSVDRSLSNTILVTLTVVIGQVLTSILGGYAFARLKFKGRDKVFLAYLGSSMIPFVVLIVPLFQEVVAIDWKDRLVVLILPFLFTPYGTFLMRQFFLQLPIELEEAAVIDGASRSRILWRILVPNATPAIATLASFSFLYAWNSFLWPFIAINSGNTQNHVLSISLSVLGGRGADNPQLTLAAVVIAMFPPILVFISAQRYFVESATSSAVKG